MGRAAEALGLGQGLRVLPQPRVLAKPHQSWWLRRSSRGVPMSLGLRVIVAHSLEATSRAWSANERDAGLLLKR